MQITSVDRKVIPVIFSFSVCERGFNDKIDQRKSLIITSYNKRWSLSAHEQDSQRLPLFVCVWVRLMFRTCGLWAGVRSRSSCWCCCRWTRLCVWACCSWTCWAIAFSFSGYSWASSERICRTGQGRIERVSLAETTLAAAFAFRFVTVRFGWPWPDLPASSWPSALSPAAALTRSSPSSGPRPFPPPGCLVTQSPRLSPPHASS